MRCTIAVAALVSGLTVATAAQAVTLPFTGTLGNTTPLIPFAPGCGGGALVTVNPGNSSQANSSNLGGFTTTIAHCVAFPPVPPFSFSGGVFSLGFFGGSLTGTYSGDITPTLNPVVVDSVTNYVITGGTGKFIGATGAFIATGTLDIATTLNSQTFAGTINAPAVPEPASWAMLIGGFGLVGVAARRRRRTSVHA